MKFLTIALTVLTSLSVLAGAAMEEKKEKMEERSHEAASDVGRGFKKASRNVQNETCEMVNGKMDCAAKRAKHAIQNSADKVKDSID